MQGSENLAFTPESEANQNDCSSGEEKEEKVHSSNERVTWGRDIEFLFSCIALSVGLGNIWRFPYVALENGGGAFVIPYFIVLILVGKPTYFMEMAMGQFSSRNSVKVYDCVPVFRGIGMGQVISTFFVATYYSSVMAITFRYFFDSFRSVLPWSYCRPEWGACIPSKISDATNATWVSGTKSSAELYFTNEVIQAKDNISDGIGGPIWSLIGFLALAWFIVFLILSRGIKSSGKASYVLGVFPYVVLIVLLIRALTLPGAFNGIKYFFTPQWDKILLPKVWYAAVTQVFFSLNIFFGNIVMYSSFNKFNHNVYRDANIITTLDAFTSLLAGCCIFGIIGNLAHELGISDVSLVVKNGPGLAFISYPDAISKFTVVPQLFSALFFFMLALLGIGSLTAMASCVTVLATDQFKRVKNWHVALCFAFLGLICGSVYLTPGGQSVLQIVDFYGATFVAFIMAVAELITFCYIYGVDRMIKDIQFMLGFKINIFWTICWKFVTPPLMFAIVIYTLWYFELPVDGDQEYPTVAHIVGWCLTAACLIQVPIFAVHKIYRRSGTSLIEKIKSSFRPTSEWGPRNAQTNQKYKEMLLLSD